MFDVSQSKGRVRTDGRRKEFSQNNRNMSSPHRCVVGLFLVLFALFVDVRVRVARAFFGGVGSPVVPRPCRHLLSTNKSLTSRSASGHSARRNKGSSRRKREEESTATIIRAFINETRVTISSLSSKLDDQSTRLSDLMGETRESISNLSSKLDSLTEESRATFKSTNASLLALIGYNSNRDRELERISARQRS